MVADTLQNNAPQLLKRIHLAINEGLPQKLFALKFLSEQERLLKITAITLELKDNYGMEMESVYEIVNYFGGALGYTPQPAAPQPAGPQPAGLLPRSKAFDIELSPQMPKSATTVSTTSFQTLSPQAAAGLLGSITGYDWRVLDVRNNKALLLSEKVIEKQYYHFMDYYGQTWDQCFMQGHLNRFWLNIRKNQYMNDANIYWSIRKRVIETEIMTNNNPWYNTQGTLSYKNLETLKAGETYAYGVNCNVFLLSIEEVVYYFGDSGDLINRKGWYVRNKMPVLKDGKGQTINDQYNNARIATGLDGNAQPWWLRSPGGGSRASTRAACITSAGRINMYGQIINNANIGVRPAMWLEL
jgi:hypothetical protein